MDHYPQPRPVLYGTTFPDEPPQTQTQPVRTGPPRWPPAPPSAGNAPEPDEWRWNGSNGQLIDYYPSEHPPVFTLLAVLYILASTYSLLQFVPAFPGPLTTPTSPLLLTLEVAIGVLVVLSLLMLGGQGYLSALFLALLQIVLGLAFGQWYSPGVWVAAAVSIVLLLPSNRLTYGVDAYCRWKCHAARWNRKHPHRTPRSRNLIWREGLDDQRMRR